MYVYVISVNENVQKIGISKHPKRRLADLQTAHHAKLTLAAEVETDAAQEVERFAHTMLRKRSLNGEWFNVKSWEAEWAIDYAIKALARGERFAPEAHWPTLFERGLATTADDGHGTVEQAMYRRRVNDELYRKLVAPSARKPTQKKGKS